MAVTARLLWSAARPVPDPEAVRDAIQAGAAVDRAAEAALEQNVGPLFWRSVQAAGVASALDPATAARLRKDAALRECQAELLQPVALRLIVEPLVAAGFEPLIFKGPAMARLYPEPGLRPMDDVDVILPPAQHDTAIAVLTDAGWAEVRREGAHYDTYLTHPRVPDLPLELHRDIANPRERANGLSGEDLWSLRTPGDCFGTGAWVLPPEVDLVALASHAAKPFHHFRRLIWSVDFAVLIMRSNMDWGRVASFARDARCTTALTVSLHNAARLGAEVPSELRAMDGSATRRASLAAVLDDEWPLIEPDPGVVHRLRYALADTARDRASLFAGEISREGRRNIPVNTLRQLWRLLRRA